MSSHAEEIDTATHSLAQAVGDLYHYAVQSMARAMDTSAFYVGGSLPRQGTSGRYLP